MFIPSRKEQKLFPISALGRVFVQIWEIIQIIQQFLPKHDYVSMTPQTPSLPPLCLRNTWMFPLQILVSNGSMVLYLRLQTIFKAVLTQQSLRSEFLVVFKNLGGPMGHSISDGPDKLGDSSSWQYRSSIFPLNVQETKPRIPTYTVTNLQLQNRTTQTANSNF